MDGVKEGELTYDTRVLGVTGVCVPLLTGRGDGEWGEPGVLGPLGRANLRSWPLFIVQRRRGQKDCRHPAGCSVTYKGTPFELPTQRPYSARVLHPKFQPYTRKADTKCCSCSDLAPGMITKPDTREHNKRCPRNHHEGCICCQ